MADWWRRLLGIKPKPRGPVYFDVLDAETQWGLLRMAGVHCYRREIDAGATKDAAEAAARACRQRDLYWPAVFTAGRLHQSGAKRKLLVTYEEMMDGVQRIARGETFGG